MAEYNLLKLLKVMSLRLMAVLMAVSLYISIGAQEQSGFGSFPENVQWPESQLTTKGPIVTCGTDIGQIPFTIQIVSDSIGSTNYNGYDLRCAGDCSGYFTAVVIGGSGDFSYQWFATTNGTPKNGQRLEEACDQVNITLIVTDNGQSPAVQCGTQHTLNVPSAIVPVFGSSVPPTCPGDCDGKQPISFILGGVTPFTFDWSPSGEGTQNATNLCAGPNNVIITDLNGCTFDTTVMMFDPPSVTPNLTVYEVSCNEVCDGSIVANPFGGNGAPYTYSWTEPTPVDDPTSDSASGLCELQTYTVTVTDSKGCTATASEIIPDKDSITIAYVGQIAPLCFNSCDGQTGVVIAGGSGTYVAVDWYQGTLGSGTAFGPTGPGAPLNASNLCGNTDYYVKVTDDRGCQDSIQMPILIPPTELITDTTITDLICFGDANGVIDVTPSGGTPGYTYEWTIITPGSGIVSPTNQDQLTLSGGDYMVVVTDAQACTDTLHLINVYEPTEIFASGVVTDVSCYDEIDGDIDITTNGGTMPYTWGWTSSVIGFVDPGTEDLAALDSGCYTLTITDANGCLLSNGDTTMCVIKPGEVYANATIVQNVTCNGAGNGFFTLSAVNGVGPYVYDMFLDGTYDDLPIRSGLAPGAYTVSVRDANGCQKDTTINITEPNPLVINEFPVHTNLSCFGSNDGALGITLSGGTAPYSTVWTTTGTAIGNDILSSTLLSAGDYTADVTDNQGCTGNITITITEPLELALDMVFADLNCNGDINATIDVTTSGGSGGYTFDWDNDGTGDFNDTEDLSGLGAGTYCLAVLDGSGCRVDSCVTLNEPDPIYFTGTTVTPVLCYGVDNGAIDISVTGGVLTSPDYSYSWSTGPITQDLNGLAPGTFIQTATDDNGCSNDTTIVISPVNEILLTVTSTQSSCGSPNADLTINASGGTTPLNYFVTDGGGNPIDVGIIPVSGTVTVSNLGADCYDVLIQDGNGCQVTGQECITDQSAPTVVFTPTNSTCANGCNGSIEIVISGGVTPYTTTWTSTTVGFIDPGTDDIFSLCEGDYTLNVTDANGCIFNQTETLTDPDPIVIDKVITDVVCFNESNGTIDITASGGTEAGTYNYSWSGAGFSAITEDVNGLVTGNYCVTVTDDNACNLDSCFVVSQPDELISTATSTDAQCGSNDGTATVTHTGGVALYSYEWFDATDNPTGSVLDTETGIGLGTYYVEVTDGSGCLDTAYVSVSEITGPTIIIDTVLNASCNGFSNGLIQTTITNSSGNPYTTTWSHGNFADDVIGLAAGVYTITVSDDVTGCTAIQSITITEPDVLTIPGIAADDACYQGGTGAINLVPTGGTSPYYYDWDNDGTSDFDDTEDLSGLLAGTYNIMVRDSNSCIATNVFILNEATEIISSTNSSATSACGAADGQASVEVTDGTPGYAYAWFLAGTSTQVGNNDTLFTVSSGCYDIVVTDNNGCNSLNSACVSDGGGPALNLTSADVTCNGDTDGSIISGATTPTITWTGPNGFTSSNADISNLEPGVYTLTITDAGGCTSAIADTVNEPLPVSIIGIPTNPTCAGQFSGSVDITITDAVGVVSFSWTGPNGFTDSNEDISGLEDGQYDVTATDANGCSTSASFNVNDPIAIILSTNSATTQCNTPTGAVSVNVSGVSAPYTYLWTNISGGPDPLINNDFIATDLEQGTYQVLVTDSDGCTATKMDSVLNSNAPTITVLSVNDATCTGDLDGEILIDVTGGTLPYSFDWDNDGTGDNDDNEDLTGVGAGIYALILTDGAGCIATNVTETINEPAALTLVEVVSDLTCNGNSSGAINITVGGGTTPYTFAWTDINGPISSSEDVNGLSAGDYNVMVTDGSGCTISGGAYTLVEPTAISLVGSSVNATCGVADGEASVVATDGAGGYSYAWTDVTAAQPGAAIGGNSDVLSNVLAGSYQVLVTDASGCMDSVIVAVSDNGAATLTSVVTDVSCYGSATGAIDITASEALTYVWSGPAPFGGASTEDISGLEAGSYSITGTNAGGCIVSQIIDVAGPLNPITVVELITDLTCFDDGSGAIDLTISGGTPSITGYTISWNGPNGYASTFEDISLLDSGGYDLVVTDSNLCNYTNTFVVSQPDSLVIDTTLTLPTCGLSDGAITVVVSGGTANYTYLWTPGGNTDTETNLSAGNYQIDISDSQGCTNSMVIALSDGNGAPLTDISMSPSCNGDTDGVIDLTVNGPNTYTFDWDNDGTGDNDDTEDLSGLQAGIYNVTVTDNSLGCISALSVTLTEPDVLAMTEVLTDLSCNGDGSGEIDVTVTGGTTAYGFSWTTSNGSGLVAGIEDQTGLSAGTYDLTVTDANGCTVAGQYTLFEPQGMTISAVVVDDSCNQGMTGDIDVTVAQGVAPYTYQWTTTVDPNFSTNEDLSFIGAETYTLTVLDANLCSKDSIFIINEPAAIMANVSVTNANCSLSDGAAIANASGGTLTNPDYIYNWISGGSSISTTSSINAVSSGLYVLQIVDDLGCQLDTNITINDIGAPTITVDNITDVTCFGGANGGVDVTVVGANGPFDYLWNPGAVAQTEDLSGVSAGDYTLEVSDVIGCTSFEVVTINEASEIVAVVTTIDATCGACDGEADLVVSGGDGNYTYIWSVPGETAATIQNLCAGVYTAQVSDGNGCIQNIDVAISNTGGPTGETITTTAAICAGETNGTADVVAIGGTAPYSYFWPAINVTGGTQNALSAGTYFVEMTDANGCIKLAEVEILEGTTITATAIIDPSTCGGTNGNITVSANGGVGVLSYTWNPPLGEVTAGISGYAEGIYTLEISDGNCSTTESFTIPGINAPTISLVGTSTLCFGDSTGSITSSVVDNIGAMTYQWYDNLGGSIVGETNADLLSVPVGTYIIEGTDAGTGCLSFATVSIDQPDSISISIPNVVDATCSGICDGEASIAVAGGTLGYTYTWLSGLSTTNSAVGMCVGIDSVFITDVNGCTVASEVLINEPISISIVVDSIIDAYCVNTNDGEIYITANGGNSPYVYSWASDPSGFADPATDDITGLFPMNYIVTVTDNSGCSFSDTLPVDTVNVVFANAGLDSSFCAGSCVDLIASASGTASFTSEWFDLSGNSISTSDTLQVCETSAGLLSYVLQINDGNCTNTDTVEVIVNALPIVDAGQDYYEIYGSVITLGGSPTASAGASYSWIPSTNFVTPDDSTAANPELNMLEDIDYVVVVTDSNGCVNSDTVNISVVPQITFPNGFSPNNDGVNDKWQIDNMKEFPESVVEVYNRWGQQLFISVGYVQQFDGTYKGKELPVGTYYYIITLNHPKYPDAYTGPITIMR